VLRSAARGADRAPDLFTRQRHVERVHPERRERIEQAKADWNDGRMPRPVGDGDEWIPAPDDPLP